ncbi:MAG: LpxD N-terminal domain-containing protein, partial [Pseudolabrys sp.]
MSEPVFLRYARGLTVDEVAALAGAEPPAGPARSRRIGNIAALDRAGPADVVFFDNKKFSANAASTHAGACLTTP